MSKKQQTIDSYNNSAQSLASKFDKQGARIANIEEVFDLVDKTNPVVLEIGRGNGRDAQEIVKRTNNYLGVDISSELIKIAEQNVPNGKFQIADFESYDFPENLDIVFAFASLIHADKDHFSSILI